MSKSSRFSLRGTSSNTVTVINSQIHRSSERNAKVALLVTSLVVGLLSATIAADHLHPIVALFLGAVLGIVCGALAWILVRIWPVVRLVWWWTPEIVLVTASITGFTVLCHHADLPIRMILVGLIVGLPVGIPPVRRYVTAWAWCLIVRHRIRVCFTQFITANKSGSLPLIFFACPTPVGERVWVWLRPGLSITDLTRQLDKIAVTCWASHVVVEQASDRHAALVRIDVKRRNALVATVVSPLVGLVDPNTPTATKTETETPTALDLPDIPNVPIGIPTTKTTSTSNNVKSSRVPVPAPGVSEPISKDDDTSEWI